MVRADDVQRLFLQAIMSRKYVSTTLAKALWEKSVDAIRAADNSVNVRYSDTKDAWDEFVTDINKRLNRLDMQLSSVLDEITGKEIYALVNQKGDEVAQMATEYTPVEISYFKAIVEQIMLARDEAYSISSLLALREVAHLKANMTKSQAENVLGSFVAKGWLLKSKRGRYSLSSRCLLELGPYLQSTYPNQVNECSICMGLITRGIACHTRNCKTRMHGHCFTKHRARYSTCPSCNTNWPMQAANSDLIAVGEDAVADNAAERRMTRRDVGEEEDEEGGDQEGSQALGTQAKKRKTNGKSKKRDDMDVEDEEGEETPEEEEAQETDDEDRKPNKKGKGRR